MGAPAITTNAAGGPRFELGLERSAIRGSHQARTWAPGRPLPPCWSAATLRGLSATPGQALSAIRRPEEFGRRAQRQRKHHGPTDLTRRTGSQRPPWRRQHFRAGLFSPDTLHDVQARRFSRRLVSKLTIDPGRLKLSLPSTHSACRQSWRPAASQVRQIWSLAGARPPTSSAHAPRPAPASDPPNLREGPAPGPGGGGRGEAKGTYEAAGTRASPAAPCPSVSHQTSNAVSFQAGNGKFRLIMGC